jgi:thymidylate kinase
MPIVIIEGGELVGKTSVVRALQDMISYHTLIKLSGLPTDTGMSMAERGNMMHKQYASVLKIMEHFHNHDSDRTLIFDRFVTTEKLMFPESYESGGLSVFEKLASMYGAIQFVLVAHPETLQIRHRTRVNQNPLEKQSLRNILDINNKYYDEYADKAIIDTKLIHSSNDVTPSEMAIQIIKSAGIKLFEVKD